MKKYNRITVFRSIFLVFAVYWLVCLSGFGDTVAFADSNEMLIAYPKTDPTENDMQQPAMMNGAGLVSSIDLQNSTLMYLADKGYISTQGMCIVDDQYMVIARDLENGAKDLMVYDVPNKKTVSSNIFQKNNPESPDSGVDVDLDHANGLAYSEGYLYVPRSGNHQDIVRLRIKDDFSIIFDSVVYQAPKEMEPSNIACKNGLFFWMSASKRDDRYFVYRTKDFKTIELEFSSDFGGNAASAVSQGMCFDGHYLYFAFSGKLNVPSSEGGQTQQKLMRSSELIIITALDGTVMRTLTFSRGNYGEIEDIDVYTVNESTYLMINCNCNDHNVACVYAVPLYAESKSVFFLQRFNIDGGMYEYQQKDFEVYCDNRECYTEGAYDPLKSNPFASGLKQDPFTDIYSALTFITRHKTPVKLYISGNYEDLKFRNLPAGIHFVLDDTKISSVHFAKCPGVVMEGRNYAVLGYLRADQSVILTSAGIRLVREERNPECAIELHESVITGCFSEIRDYTTYIQNYNSVVNVAFPGEDSDSSGPPDKRQDTDFSALHNENQWVATDKTLIYKTSYKDKKTEISIAKNGKNVVMSLSIGDGETALKDLSRDLSGVLPEEVWPEIELYVPSFIVEDREGLKIIDTCLICVSCDGSIQICGELHNINTTGYILATANYLVS